MDKAQTYNDGLVKIYSTANIAAPGDLPAEGMTLVHTLRYEEETVGINRYNLFAQNGVQVDRMIRTPFREGITTQDHAMPNDGKVYRIVMVQYRRDVVPPSLDLSLSLVMEVVG